MKVETILLAGYCAWGIAVDGMLDCDILLSNTEIQAAEKGRLEYGEEVITTADKEHYSNS